MGHRPEAARAFNRYLSLAPGASDDQSRALVKALARAGENGQALFLPPSAGA